jgi:hypothetical protein
VQASHAPLPLPAYPSCSDVRVQRLLGARRGENRLVPNLVDTADDVTPPVSSLESASRHDGLYDVRRCHAADTHAPEDNKPRCFLRIADLR